MRPSRPAGAPWVGPVLVWLAAWLLGAAGCSTPGATYLVVTVKGPDELVSLAVTLGNSDLPPETRSYPLTGTSLPARFSAELPAALAGELELQVDGQDGRGATVARARRVVKIQAGRINETDVTLLGGPPPPDGGPGDGGPPDGGPDVIVPPDGPDGGDGPLPDDGPGGPDADATPDVADVPVDVPPDGPRCLEVLSDPNNCGACGHSCRGGACRDGLCQPVVVATGQARPFALAVDATGIYWTSIDDSTVKRAGLTGGTPEPVATDQPVPTGIAIDELGVYWLNYVAGTVMRGQAGQSPQLLVDGPRDALAMTTDGTEVFWITDGALGTLLKVPRGGAASATPLLEQLDGARDLAVDATHVYLTLNGSGEIYRIAKDGAGEPELVIDSQNDPIGIAVHAGQVYWCNRSSGNVRSAPIAGSPASTLLAMEQDRPYAIAVDDSGVYWVNYGDGKLMHLAPGSTTPRMLGQGPAAARDVVLDATSIYWITEGVLQDDGTVMTVAKPAP